MANLIVTNVAPKDVADAHYADLNNPHQVTPAQLGLLNAGGDLSGTYPNPAILNSAVLAKVLTGLNVIGASLAATDTIIEAFGKVQNQINGVLGGAIYQGVWNATTNSPALVSSVGTKGFYYVVSVAGSTNLNGTTDWKIGDWAIFNGTIWEKVDNTDAVSSVNGFIGAVNLTTADVAEVTNLYFTTARVLLTVLTGFSAGANSTILATDTLAQALAKVQGQINARATTSDVTNAVANKPEFTGIAMSDETTVLPAASTTVPLATMHVPYAMTLTQVFAGLRTAGTGAAVVTVDIHLNGTPIMNTTKILFTAGVKLSANGTLTTTALSAGDYLEFFLDVRDTNNVATGLKCYIVGHQ